MAKQINVSVGGVVKKVKEVPLGIGGVVKKAKFGKCGVGGVVKTFFENNVLFDNGSTSYTWIGGTISGGYLIPDGTRYMSGQKNYSNTPISCYADVNLDISGYSKCKLTFIDSTDSSSTYKNGIFYIADANKNTNDFGNCEVGWERSVGSTITVTFTLSNLSGNFDLSNFKPEFAATKWKSDFLIGINFTDKVKISKIWFE